MRRLAPILAASLVALAPAAWAAETADGPVATADAAKETDAQIAAYLAETAALGPGPGPAALEPVGGPHRPHGEVSVAIGTGGYRSAYARTQIPVGETGSVSIAIGETRFGGGRPARPRNRDGLPAPFGPRSPSSSMVGATGFEPATP